MTCLFAAYILLKNVHSAVALKANLVQKTRDDQKQPPKVFYGKSCS